MVVALKLLTVFAPVSEVPPTELVVSKAPETDPVAALSPIVPPAVRPTFPPVASVLATFSAIFFPALTVMPPVVLLAAALSNTSLAAPVAVKPTVPEPFAVTPPPIVRVPALAVRLIAPLEPPVDTVPLVVKPVELLTVMPPPALLLAAKVSPPAAVFVIDTLPVPLFVNERFDAAVSSAFAAPMPVLAVAFNVPAVTSVAEAALP